MLQKDLLKCLDSPQAVELFRRCKPQNPEQLKHYCYTFFGYQIPDVKICPDHSTPFDYLKGSFFRQHDGCACWANRGGAKTLLGGLSALLDSIHTPNCATRILGGSEEQSDRMYQHSKDGLKHFSDYLDGEATRKITRFSNGSTIGILTASQKSVRGTHVPRLKLDEIEEIDPDVYEAAVFIAQSTKDIRACTENFSTMHRFGGTMDTLCAKTPTLYKWCLWETIEKCVDRTCSQCPLWRDCQGKAENADGYISIDDAIGWMRDSSRASWEAEQLCLRPTMHGAVYPEFDDAIHVKPLTVNHNACVYRAIDWGFNYFACLWLQEDKNGAVYVLKEYKGEGKSLPVNIAAIKEKEQPFSNLIRESYVDPAGTGANDQTGKNNIQVMRDAGIHCEYTTSRKWRSVVNGINLVRNFLAPASGKARLYISDKCPWLINSFHSYAWRKTSHVYLDEPEKNTPWEHPMDALRYYFVNRHVPPDVRFYSWGYD